MPLSGNASSGRFSGFAEDLGGYYAKDAFRERLHFLFAQIEKEFDTLYMENLSRKNNLKRFPLPLNPHLLSSLFTVQEKLEGVSTGNNSNLASGNSATVGISGVGGRLFNIENVDSGTSTGGGAGGGGDPPGSASKNFKFGSSAGVALAMGSSTPNMSTPSAALSNKVKASHKLKAQTSRIVSSFKQASVVCSVVREFNGHKVRAFVQLYFDIPPKGLL